MRGSAHPPGRARRALLALTLLGAGMLAIVDVGGTAADAFGLLAIAVALVNFDSAVFRIAAGSPERDQRLHGPSVR